MRKKVVILLLAFIALFTTTNAVFAQFGTYGCFSSGSTGGCRPTTGGCTNGGVPPTPNQCTGRLPGDCNSAGPFACAGPGGVCTNLGGTGQEPGICCSNLTKISVGGGYFICASGSGPNAPLPTMASGPQFVHCNGGNGIQTAIGCIPIAADNQGTGIASFFLRWGLGIAGGIALILIVYSGFMMSTSTGDPRKLQAGKELLTGAVSGLILIVLSAFILDFIGVDILGIL